MFVFLPTVAALLLAADDPPDSPRWRPTKARMEELLGDLGRPFKDEQDLADALAEFGGAQSWSDFRTTGCLLRRPDFVERIDRLYRQALRRDPTPGELVFETQRYEVGKDDAIILQRLRLAEKALEVELTGTVADADGKPLAEASVVATSNRSFGPGYSTTPDRARATQTDNRGRYKLVVRPGCVDDLRVVASAEGRESVEKWYIPFPSRKPPEPRLDFSLKPGLIIAGVVTGADGRPVANARIYARQYLPNGRIDAGRAPDYNALSDAKGEFELHGVHGDLAEAGGSVSAPGFVPTSIEIKGPDLAKKLTVKLNAGCRIAGKAVDDQGRPVPYACLDARGERFGAMESTFADELGRFELNALAPGKHMLVAQSETHGAAFAEAESSAAPEPEPITLTLGKGAWIEGAVKTADGSPAAGALVLHPHSAGAGDFHSDQKRLYTATVADADGNFKLGPLPDDHADRRFTAWTWPERLEGTAVAAPGAKGVEVVVAKKARR